MKRTNLVLDEDLLEKALKMSGERTYSGAVNRALDEMVRRLTVTEGLRMLQGSHAWEGDLAEMRGDSRIRDEAKRARSSKGKARRGAR